MDETARNELAGLGEAWEGAESHASAFAGKLEGAKGEAREYGGRWEYELDTVGALVSAAAKAMKRVLEEDSPDKEALAAGLSGLAEAIGSGYDKMLKACDHAGEDGGPMQDACYELEDLYNCACAAAEQARKLDDEAFELARRGRFE